MKKLIYCALALAAGLFAASCQQENLEPVAQENTVTYTVEVPGVATKAYGEGQEVNQLIYEVWKTDETGEINDDAVRLYQVNNKELQLVEGVRRAQITLNLVKDQTYRILLWAQVEKEAGFENYNTENLTRVSYKYNVASAYSANQEQYDAFYATKVISTFTAPKPEKISLKRPFAQLNIATENNVTDYTVTMNTSKVVVEGVPTVFNVATSEASALTTVTFNTFNVPEGTVTVTTDAQSKSYDYAAMNYVFASKSGINAKVSYDINSTLTSKNLDGSNGVETEAKVSNIIPNVPLKENYRTNIVGNLLSSSTTYEIVVDAKFGTDGNGDMFVINDGLINNINGDYEVTNENGLEYAIENLFAQGGNFYLTAELYDMTDYDVTAPSVSDNVTLNIYGETPVVTRSATASFAGVTIIGLDSIIDVISEDANVSISGVELTDDGSVLVQTNNGILVVSDARGEEAIVGSGTAIKAGEITDFAKLKAALATGVKTIEIAADIEADEVALINGSVVINGNDKTFTTSANRAFRLTTTGIEVIFNDLKIVSEAVRVGSSDIRGVSIDNVDNITLTLNNSSHDFTDTSANDWTYAVNVVGGTNHKVTINGGKYEGANVVNVRGDNHTITIDGAVLTSLYQPSSAYYGFCVSLQDAENSIATIKNSTLNSVHAKAFGGTTKNEFVLENNTDNTQVYPFYIENNPYLTLNEAFAAAENNATIYAPFNAEIASSTVPEGKKVTLVLQNQSTKYETQLTGTDESTGSFALINVNPGADLTITGPGSIKLSATNNRGWNAYSSVVSNQRGTLTVNGGATIEHLGGTAMAYGIDNLTNGKGTKATTTVNGATIISPYTAIRQFLNGTEADNALTVNAGSVIDGGSRGVWMQGPSVNTNSGSLSIKEGAEVSNLHIALTEGTTTVDIELSAAASAIGEGGVTYKNVPAGYSVENVGGVWTILTAAVVNNDEELAAAISKMVKGGIITLTTGTYTQDIKLTVDALGAADGDLVFRAAEGATPVIAGTVTLGYRNQGVGAAMWNGNVTFEGITFDHAEAAKHSIDVQDVESLTLKDCKIIGDGEYGIGSASGNATGASTIQACTFENASMQVLGNFGKDLVVDECTFNQSRINVQGGYGVTVQNCVFNNTLKAAHVGDSFYCVRSNSIPITVKETVINIDSELTEVATSQTKWYLLANRGTTNWTVENVAVTLSDAAALQTELVVTACTSTGVINTTNLTVNGVQQ